MKKLSKTNLILLIILLIGFFIRILFAFTSDIPWWDESVYLNLGHDLSKNPFDYSLENKEWSDLIPFSNGVYSWPRIGFRPPLLPYSLAIFYALNLDFLTKFLMPFIGTLTVFLVYLLGKEIFNKREGLISASIMALVPIHVIYSGKVLNDVFVTFFITLSFLFFWKGFEKKEETYKFLWGVVLGLGLLTRYTLLWIIPIFPIYLLVKNKSLNFIKDKYLWYGIGGFFAVLIPWFIYGFFEYGSIFGSFIHGFKAADYWGGNQLWFFFFQNSWYLLSILGILFVFFLFWIVYSKDYKKREIYLLLIWFFFYFIMLIIMPHKEGRFLIPVVPTITLITGYSLNKIKFYKGIIVGVILLILFFSCALIFIYDSKVSSNINSMCFLETMDFLKERDGNYKTVSENPPIVRFFTNTESSFYPRKITEESILEMSNSTDYPVYFVFNRLNSGFEKDKLVILRKILDENYKLEFECSEDPDVNFVYSNNL